MKNQLFLILTLLIGLSGTAQLQTYPIAQLEQLNPKRSFVIFIHTNWCTFCQQMKIVTFQDKKVIEKLNANYYFSSLNAEEKDTIKLLGKEFSFQKTGLKTGKHELAVALGTTEKGLQLPTTVILNKNFEIEAQFPYQLSAEALINLLEIYEKS